MDVISLIIKE